jgi:hypothetical protein
MVNAEAINSPRVRKVMYFTQYFRDERLRRFVCEVVSGTNGKWRVPQLLHKRNARFFEQFSERATTPKIRSNIEYFLLEARLFNPQTERVYLDLPDGWLTEAMQVAAQHQRSAVVRRAMTGAPIDYLIAHHLNGLANATRYSQKLWMTAESGGVFG